MLPRYEAGEYIFFPSGGAMRTSDFYGDTVIPPGYIKQKWGEHFSLATANDDAYQAIMVLRHKAPPQHEALPRSLLGRLLALMGRWKPSHNPFSGEKAGNPRQGSGGKDGESAAALL